MRLQCRWGRFGFVITFVLFDNNNDNNNELL